MGKKTDIPWTDHTYNPWIGCVKCSTGCLKCYTERDMKRYGKNFNIVKRTTDNTFNSPLKWKDNADVFTCSWSDFFIVQADAWRKDAWDIIKKTPHLRYLILTKRPERINDCLPTDWDFGRNYPHVWLGITIESVKYIDRIDSLAGTHLLNNHFISAEPLLDDISAELYSKLKEWDGIKWIIAGCESGTPARETKVQWVRNMRDICAKMSIKFFLKQMRNEKGELVAMPSIDGKVWKDKP